MRKLSVKPRQSGRHAPITYDGIEFDDERRLRNALKALTELDPNWESWLAEVVPMDLPLSQRRQLVEFQARTLIAQHYSFLGKSFMQEIIDSGFYFTDDGALKAHL